MVLKAIVLTCAMLEGGIVASPQIRSLSQLVGNRCKE